MHNREISERGELPEREQAERERQAMDRRLQEAEDVERTDTEWVERGIQDVPVRDLPDPEGIDGAEDFKKVSYQEMQDGLAKLETMKPYIESGAGTNSDYWREVDQHYAVEYKDGYQKVYDAFYGGDAVRLEKDGDSYDIINGRHRIWAAKQLGMETIPASVSERRRKG